jgi:Tfp pilus assembly protein PilV
VEYEDYAYVIPETQERYEITRIRDYAGRFKARFTSCNEPGKVDVAVKLTPEQAIAATLGRGTCHDVYPNATYCFTCSECGHVRRFIQGWNNVTDSSQDEFNFCPNCGRKVIG